MSAISDTEILMAWSNHDRRDISELAERLADACFGIPLREDDAINLMVRMGVAHSAAVRLIEETRAEAAPR